MSPPKKSPTSGHEPPRSGRFCSRLFLFHSTVPFVMISQTNWEVLTPWWYFHQTKFLGESESDISAQLDLHHENKWVIPKTRFWVRNCMVWNSPYQPNLDIFGVQSYPHDEDSRLTVIPLLGQSWILGKTVSSASQFFLIPQLSYSSLLRQTSITCPRVTWQSNTKKWCNDSKKYTPDSWQIMTIKMELENAGFQNLVHLLFHVQVLCQSSGCVPRLLKNDFLQVSTSKPNHQLHFTSRCFGFWWIQETKTETQEKKNKPHKSHSYCWWPKSCTSWCSRYPSIHRVLYIAGGAGFLPSTVCLR